MENTKIQVNYISEKDMDLLIIEEFISNDKFAKIFLDKLSKENYQIRIITNMEDDSKEEVFLMNF